ncbi:MAG: class I SAM-dependent methyltransferase [Patescibacteria group bacterium]
MTASPYSKGYFGGGETTHTVSLKKRRSRSHREEIDDFIARIPHGASVLDVGCGQGRLLTRIKEQRPDLRLSGIDISDVKSLVPAGVAFTQGSVEDLTNFYAPNTFDAVLCQHVIEHLVSPINLIAGIREVLRPGGSFFIETPNWTRMYMPFSFLYFWNDYTHIHPYTPFSMSRMLLEYEFSVESIRTLPSCTWRIPGRFKKSELSNEKKQPQKQSVSAFVYTHQQSSFFARGLSYCIDPLIKDLLIAVGTKP